MLIISATRWTAESYRFDCRLHARAFTIRLADFSKLFIRYAEVESPLVIAEAEKPKGSPPCARNQKGVGCRPPTESYAYEHHRTRETFMGSSGSATGELESKVARVFGSGPWAELPPVR